jgi:hypothetical protein
MCEIFYEAGFKSVLQVIGDSKVVGETFTEFINENLNDVKNVDSKSLMYLLRLSAAIGDDIFTK